MNYCTTQGLTVLFRILEGVGSNLGPETGYLVTFLFVLRCILKQHLKFDHNGFSLFHYSMIIPIVDRALK
jgi:hypothetical protein